MRLVNKQLSRSVQLWIKRGERRHPPKVGYNSELRDWVQHIIMEAEKNKDFRKKEQIPSLLKDPNVVAANRTSIGGL